jgi:hypothetical protein
MKAVIDRLIKRMKELGHVVFEEGQYNLNLVGVRSKNRMPNNFDDTIYCFFKDSDNEWVLLAWKATTDPGTYWLKNPGRSEGTAILCEGQHRAAFTLGKHKGEYECLVQCKPVKVYRDSDKDEVLDLVNAEDTFSGIQIHRANPSRESSVVDKWSAGCQVFANPTDFYTFMRLYKKAAAKWGDKITYTLLEEF